MRKVSKLVLIAILLVVLQYSIVFAADADYRLMHNDQDLLVIGEITEENANEVVISVSHIIISGKDLNIYHPRVFNERPTKVKVLNNFKYLGFRTASSQYYDTVGPKLNDYILISLNKQSGDTYECVWGAYKISSTDYKTLKILMANDASEGVKANFTAIEYFINSDGQYSDFSFDNNKVYLKKAPNEIIQIYPKESDINKVQQTVSNNVQTENVNGKSVYIIGGISAVAILAAIIIKKK